ncbi:unnamed protein product [Aphanomyces euteiches]|nr:hypothetical protein AeRB84_008572 [Aphanomyces euteiches]
MGAASTVAAADDDCCSVEKQQGDVAFHAGQFQDAIAWYTRGILAIAPATRSDALATLYNHRSAAFLGVRNFDKALDDALRAIELHPTWPKGYFQASSAAMHLDNRVEAREHLMKALALAPNDAALRNLQRQLLDNFEPHEHGSGTVYSWGRGDEGQLGHGLKKTQLALPTMLDAFRGKHVVEVAAGAMHSLALTVDGNVYAWGNNAHGQCGMLAGLPTIQTPQLVPKLMGRQIAAIACGAGHSLAVSCRGDVFSWGIGKQGQLGHGDACESELEPRLIQALAALEVTSVACGIAHSVFLLRGDRSLHGCGLNSYGQLGLGHTTAAVETPTRIGGVLHVQHVACGGAHTCVVDMDGRVWSSGANSCGQLGLGHADDMAAFTVVPMAVPCAFVACGEEFSSAITTTRDVFMWGLGIAGQMGDGEYTSYDSPRHVDGLPPIDQVCLSQAQVFAITEGGGVWTWGLPGDRAHDADAVVQKPEQVAAFFGKKRIRQLCCGRKHYVIVTNGTYGPKSTVSMAKTGPYQVGEWIRFKIVARDMNGDDCTTGGARFTARFVLHEAADANAALGLVAQDSAVQVEDNMDGTYSGRCRSRLAGIYHVDVALHTLTVHESPIEVEVEPGAVHPPSCEAAWKRELPLVGAAKEEIICTITLRDAFNNAVPADDQDKVHDLVVVVQVIHPSTNSIEWKKAFPWGDRVVLTCPDAPGVYAVHVGIDGIDAKSTVVGSPFPLTIPAPKVDLNALASTCVVAWPPNAIVGNDLGVQMPWEDDHPCAFDGISLHCQLTPQQEHTLSARALVRWGHSFSPLVQTSPPGSAQCVFQPRIAGEYAVSAAISNGVKSQQVASGTTTVAPGRAHVDFTEFPDGKRQLRQLQDARRSSTTVELLLQLRDKFGNACDANHPDDVVTAFLSRSHGLDGALPVDVKEGQVAATYVLDVAPTEECSAFLHVLLNDKAIMYSPFALHDGGASDEDDRPLETAPVEKLTLESLEKLKLEEITRRRAMEALRREQARQRADTERKRQQQAMKRTGGGFTVQFKPT